MFCGSLTVIPVPVGAIPLDEGSGVESGSIDYQAVIEDYLKLDEFEVNPVTTAQGKLDTMKLMLETEGYELYADEITGEVAILKKATGETLFTNPWDITTSETNSIDEKKKLLSQVIINYTDNGTSKEMNSTVEAAQRGQIKIKYIKNGIRVEYAIGRQNSRYLVPRMASKTSFENNILIPMRQAVNNSVSILITEKATFKTNEQPIDNYPFAKAAGLIEVGQSYNYYDLICLDNPDFDMNGPIVYTDERPKNDPSEKRNAVDHQAVRELLNNYTLYDPSAEGVTDKQISDMYNAYPITKKMAVYVFDEKAKGTDLIKSERHIKTYVQNYSFEQLDADHLETEYEGTTKAPALFRLALEYTLDDQGLSVRLPANGIRFDESLYQLDSITVLPFMGAGKSGNGGYNFFPDGSGALFDYEDLNKGANTTLSAKMYGTDFAYHKLTGKHQETVRYPVYGSVEHWKGIKTVIDYDNIKSPAEEDENGNIIKDAEYGTKSVFAEDDHGFLAIIEEGDSMAQIATAHINASSEYSSMQVTFYPRSSDTYNMSDAISVGQNTEIKVVSDRKYVGNYKIKYIMLTDTEIAVENKLSNYYECSWVGMAEAYRDYLEYTGALSRISEKEADANIPLYIETFGTVETVEKILSMPVNVMTPLTTFEDVKTMYEELSDAIDKEMAAIKDPISVGEKNQGFSNINFRLTGYANGGMFSTMPYHLNWEESLGGAAGFEKLVETAREEGFGIFPDFDFAYVNETSLFDGVSLLDHAVKTIDNRYTSRRVYDATYQNYVGYYDLAISPAFFARFVTKFTTNYMKYNPMGISVSTLGTALNSDFDENDPYNREDAMQFTVDALRQISLLKNEYGEDMQIMVDGGNSYTLKYVDHIVNAPLNSSNYNVASNTVPFVGMVLHGYINYAGTPINEEGNLQAALLRAIENGSGLYFKLSYQNTDVLKEFNRLSNNYSVRYDIWKNDVVDMYVELNDLLSDLQTKLIIDHEFLVADRIPDADEAEADRIALEKAEALKEAEKLAKEAKEALRAALELRKTPGIQSDAVVKALKQASDQAIKATKAAAKIDSSYVDQAYAALCAANDAAAAADAAYLTIYGDAACENVKTSVKRRLPGLFQDSKVVSNLVAELGNAHKTLINGIYNTLIETASNAAADSALAIATAAPVKYATSVEKAEAAAKDQAELLAAIKAAVRAEAETMLENAAPADLAVTETAALAILDEIVSRVEKSVADLINTAKNGYNSGKNKALDKVNAIVTATTAKNEAINAAIEAGALIGDINAENPAPYEAALTAAKNALNTAMTAANESEETVKPAYKAKVALEAAQKAYDLANAEYNEILAEINSGVTTQEERELLKVKEDARAKAKTKLDKAQEEYDIYEVTGDYAVAVSAYETVESAKKTLDLVKAAIKAVKAETEKLNAASDAEKAAAALRIVADEKFEAYNVYVPSLRENISNIQSAYASANQMKETAEKALVIAKEATEKLFEKLNATKADPEATDAEKQRAQQFYDDAVAAVAATEANLAAIEDKIGIIKAIADSDALLRAKVLVFGDEDIETNYNTADTNNAGVISGVNDVIGSVEEILTLKEKYEAAKAEYQAASKKYEELLLIDLGKLDMEEASEVLAERISTAVNMNISKSEMEAAKAKIDTYTGVFRNRYSTIISVYAALESAKAYIDSIAADAEAINGVYAGADAVYLKALENKAVITGLYNEATATFENFFDLSVEAGVIDENGNITNVIAAEEQVKKEEEVTTVSKYTYDDGSVVAVTYGGKDGNDDEAYRTFILNYNSFDIKVTYGETVYEIKAYDYQVINH